MAELATRRRPAELTRFQTEMNDLFSRFFEGVGDLWPFGGRETMLTPAVDVSETENEITVKAELPGLKAQDINLEVRDGTLIISGQKKEEVKDEKENYYHVERRYGSFYRTIPLSTAVDPDKIEASCKEGVLTVKMPKTEMAKPKKIPVK